MASNFYAAYGINLGAAAKLILHGKARVWVIGDSTADKSRQPTITHVLEAFPLNYNATFTTSRNTSSYATLGQGSTYSNPAGTGTRTDRDIGASFGVVALGTNTAPMNAAEIPFSGNVADSTLIFTTFTDYNGAWTADNPPVVIWGRGQWTLGATVARVVYLKHADAPATITERYGRTNSGGSAFTGGGTSTAFSMVSVTPTIATTEATISAAASITANTWVVGGYASGVGYDETGKTLVCYGVLFYRTLSTAQQMMVIPTGQSGMQTVQWIKPGGTQDQLIVAAAGASTALTTDARVQEFLEAVFDEPPNIIFIQLGKNRYTGVNAAIDEYSGGVYTAKHTDYLRDIGNRAKEIVAAMGGTTPIIVLSTDTAYNADDVSGASRRTRTLAAAAAEGWAVLDTYQAIYDTIGSAQFASYYDDASGLHLNAGGQNWLTRVVWSIFQDSYTKSVSGRKVIVTE